MRHRWTDPTPVVSGETRAERFARLDRQVAQAQAQQRYDALQLEIGVRSPMTTEQRRTHRRLIEQLKRFNVALETLFVEVQHEGKSVQVPLGKPRNRTEAQLVNTWLHEVVRVQRAAHNLPLSDERTTAAA